VWPLPVWWSAAGSPAPALPLQRPWAKGNTPALRHCCRILYDTVGICKTNTHMVILSVWDWVR
jgi:hypothetical protein